MQTNTAEMCSRGGEVRAYFERKGTRMYLTCVWAGRVPLWPSGYFFMAGRQNYSVLFPPLFNSQWYFKHLYTLFYSFIWVIRISYYLSQLVSALFILKKAHLSCLTLTHGACPEQLVRTASPLSCLTCRKMFQ